MRKIRLSIYNTLVNKQTGIRERYHEYHDDATGAKKLLSYGYLASMNFQYYLLRRKSIGKSKQEEIYEYKKLKFGTSESVAQRRRIGAVDEIVRKLAAFDMISFDVFDTLLFRPFSEPTDVFHFLGQEYDVQNMKSLRITQESLARKEHNKKKGNNEVTFKEIWNHIEKDIGIPAAKGMEKELQLEKKFCYANPFMKKVFDALKEMGKRIIVVSDMYLPSEFIAELLTENGYTGIEKIYVSCEYGAGKSDGDLYSIVDAQMGKDIRKIHVGDNPYSDYEMAKKKGWKAVHYPNTDTLAAIRRPYDMSAIIGGAYRGIVNHYLLSGERIRTEEYEYGYIYGGLFVLGYCHFIHEYCRREDIEKVLFLARDGDILKQVYDQIYPNENTSYIYWSRLAAVKVMAPYNKYDFFRRFVYHKSNSKYTVGDILEDMEFGDLKQELKTMSERDLLTVKNAKELVKFLNARFDEIIDTYSSQEKATKQVFEKELSGVRKAAAVDIGWAGSGALSISHLVEKVWKLPCEIKGIVAGTNTIHNDEPDASEIFLQSGRMVAYLYSQSHNREVMKKHDPAKGYNMFWELLLASVEPSFKGYYIKDGNIVARFGDTDPNIEGILDIQQGIKDFVEDYCRHFYDFPFMFDISGRDAYAPMLVAAGKNEKYLKNMLKRFSIKENVN